MSIWRQLRYGLRRLVRGGQYERDVQEEVEQFFEQAAAEGEARGLGPEEARRAARREVGNMTSMKDRVRDYGWENQVRALAGDLRFAARQLVKHPAFTFTATLTLALGIGANAAMFTVVESILLAPLPYAHPDRVAFVDTHWTNTGHTTPRMTGPDAVDVRAQAKSLEAVSLMVGGNEGVRLRDHSTYTVVTWVDENFARVFSLQPMAGRLFADGESHRAALVSEHFARDNFGSAQAAVGQTLEVESETIEIVGVVGGGFDYPQKTQVWEAFSLRPDSMVRSAFNYRAVGLLRDGVNFKQAQAELDGISQRLATAYPADNRYKQLTVVPLGEALTGNARPTLLLLWATAGLILLIACVNVTHLQLVRAMERQREIAIRKALGSSRWQVIRPVLLESLLLAGLGAAAAMLLALGALRVLVNMAPKELPRASEIHLNGWVIAFTVGLSLATALAASIFPAMRALKVDAAEALKNDASRGMNRKGATTLRNGLVIAEVGATFVLAMAAGLLLRTMSTLIARDMGLGTRQLLVVDADAPAHADKDYDRVLAQFNEIFEKLGVVPGVKHVAGIMGLPTGAYGSDGYYNTRGGLPPDANHKPWSYFSVASPGYFKTMEIPLVKGRDFTAQDTAENPFVAVISESLAKRSFGDAAPVGRQIQCGLDSDKWMTIVGVVGDVRQGSPAENPGPTLYMPMTQHKFYANQIHLVLRTEVPPLSLLNTVQATIGEVNPFIALRFTTMDAMVNQSMETERFRALLISSFTGIGLLLAMLGVYGTMAYTVAQRTFEIGVRMAFGAEKGAILRGVLEQAAKLALWGVALGLGLSLLLGRLVTSMLVGVQPNDPLSFGAAGLLLLVTAVAAAFVPGWKATHVHPMVALRVE
jgi:putative ABC transport system permease protein